MKKRYMLYALLALLSALIISVITYFAAFAITFLVGGMDLKDVTTIGVNEGIYNLLRFTIMILLYGRWYHYQKGLEDSATWFSENEKEALRMLLQPARLFTALLLGVSLQITTSGILKLLGELFPAAMSDYNTLINGFLDKPDALFVFTVVCMGPVTEELLFRGVILKYMKDYYEDRGIKKGLLVANILQAILFGTYHGNIYQGIYAALLGFLLGCIMLKTSSLIVPIALHAFINLSLYVVPDELYSGLAADCILTAVFAVLSAGCIFLIMRYFSWRL